MKKLNNKAAANWLAIGIIAVIIIVVVAAAALLGSPAASPATNNLVTVYIDETEQKVNITQPQTLTWANAAAGNVYTKNFTVANPSTTSYKLMLLTTEPLGTTQTWAYNNTLLPAQNYASGSLTLTLSTSPSTGAYTWRLLATNSSIADVTPTPGPTATPIANDKEFTLTADIGIKNITLAINGGIPYTFMPTDLPATYKFTSGDTFKFQVNMQADYTFNGWDLNDGTFPTMTTAIILSNVQGNFTVNAKTILTPLS